MAAVRLAEQRAVGIKDDLPQILALLNYLFQQAEAGHYHRDMIHNLILQSLALNGQNKQAVAQQALQQAINLARPGGLVRPFLDSDPALTSMLAQIDDLYAHHLHRAFVQEQQKQGQSPTTPLDLTPREYEILQEIISGLSNKEIEEKLFISHNTVRTHIKNLYSKLEVTSRTQAIRKARDLNLMI
ncbi:LuxR C-terminal-related transcriptional regulator [Chloroflexi bacterium TSY]|nr:LuxR C-terminal-related transcriptional regulator [Chloroflexi bacterium TSY]